MKALVLNEDQNIELRDIEIPEPAPNQVRIKVKRAGICASDISYWKFGSDRLVLPVVLGHEASGVVDKVGLEVTAFKPGDNVVPQTTYKVCGKCRFCHTGRYNLCVSRIGIGSKANGAMAEYVVVPETSVMPMPDAMTYEEGAFVEVLACGVHAVNEEVHVPINSTVLVIGPGPIGLGVAQVAKTAGAKVIIAGLSSDEERLKLAKDTLGIDVVVDIQTQDIYKIINDMTDNYGADIIIECSGSNKASAMAIEIAAKQGTVVQMGVLHSNEGIDFSKILHKELKVIGSLSQKPTAWHTAMNIIEDKKVNVKNLVSHIFSLDNWEEAFKTASGKEGLKVMFNPEL